MFKICLQLLPFTFWAEFGFSLGPTYRTSSGRSDRKNDLYNEFQESSEQNISDCEEQPKSSVKAGVSRPEHKYERDIIRLENRSKQKRNRIKKNRKKSQSLKIIGINCAGLMSKINSIENLLNKENP